MGKWVFGCCDIRASQSPSLLLAHRLSSGELRKAKSSHCPSSWAYWDWAQVRVLLEQGWMASHRPALLRRTLWMWEDLGCTEISQIQEKRLLGVISMALGHHLVIHSLLWFPSPVVSNFTYSVPQGLLAQVYEHNITKTSHHHGWVPSQKKLHSAAPT